jgi:hypothetical protein
MSDMAARSLSGRGGSELKSLACLILDYCDRPAHHGDSAEMHVRN